MAVRSPWQARDTLRELIYGRPVPIRQVLREPYLPDGWSAVADQPRTTNADLMVGGYGDQTRYDFAPDIAHVVAATPAAVLDDPTKTEEHQRAFVTTSLDLTMQGGTTSGVVYPLAVCELATAFRFRNVGGASAGAIAAAVTAAAELGRSRRMLHEAGQPGTETEQDPSDGTPEPPPRGTPQPPTRSTPGSPTFRSGFAGLADLMAWLTQTSPAQPEREEFRLAQLFRPGPRTYHVFRVATAAMRGRSWQIPLLALFALGPFTRLITVALVALTVVVTGWVGARFAGQLRPWWQTIGWGVLDTAAFSAAMIGLVNLVQGGLALARSRRESEADRRTDGTPLGGLRRHTSGAPVARSEFLWGLISGLVLLGLAVVDAFVRTGPFVGACFVGLSGSFLVVVWLTVGLLRMINGFGAISYGLIGGTTPARKRGLLDRLAAVPPTTVKPSLVPWLSASLTQLAGLPDGTVLRFGHLWHGSAYHPTQGDPSADEAARAALPPSDHRLVNLELMTTDLTRRRPYTFPLRPSPDPSDELFLRLDQLEAAGVFPSDVLAALRERKPITARDERGQPHDYHPLPRPADLPVIFAVRLSMALPGLFQAIPMHRFVEDTPVRDDLGRQITVDGRPLTSFGVDGSLRGAERPQRRAQQLWFSDGGITSNFPVHFFDAPLPRWPTVSLNLGSYPQSDPIQDVSLPQDWDPSPTPVEPLGGSGLALPGAILETAMSWRDSMQSAMPGFRNRIAQVRSRRNEGGTNLFMTTATIASLGLRGVVAGARLKARFSDGPQWDRFRWLRLRVALSNLEELRESTCAHRSGYAGPLDDPRWLTTLRTEFESVPPGLSRAARDAVTWYEPDGAFWPVARNFLDAFADAYAGGRPDPMTTNPPLPEPRFRQVPLE
jgi:predicted acylesterase/phospholipase RssA